MIKKIDNLGRIVVPKGYRQMLGIKSGDPLDVEVENGKLTISPHQDGCAFCGASTIASTYREKNICRDCLSSIKAMPGL